MTQRTNRQKEMSRRKALQAVKNRRLGFESLEGRQMMAGDIVVNWNDGVITVEGTESADVITLAEVRENGERRITVSGNKPVQFTEGLQWIPERALGAAPTVVVRGRGGNDIIVNNTTISTTIYGDDGNDTIVGGDGHDTIYGGAGQDTVEGGAGDDKIYGEFDSNASIEGNFGTVVGVGDFDGDRDDDLLFRSSTGSFLIWRMQDGQAVDTKAVAHDSRDQFLGIGDLDGDRDDDLLFVRKSNDSDFNLLITYVMQQGNLVDTRANRSDHGRLLGDYIGTGDFDGDGRDGVLTRRAGDNLLIEYRTDSRGVSFDRSGRIRTDADETILGIGKFDGDSGDDLLTLRARDNRLIGYTNQLSKRDGVGYKDGSDRFLGVGDFVAGNSRHELLMQRADGRYIEYVFNAQGSVADIRGAGLAANFSSGTFQAVGNFNGDDFSDTLWRESGERLVTQVFGYGAATGGFTYADVRDGREAGYAAFTSGMADDLHGGTGRDEIHGGLGIDLLRGHADEDILATSGGLDTISNGAPNAQNGGYRGRLDSRLRVVENAAGVLGLDGSDFDDVIIVTSSEGRLFIPGVGYFSGDYQRVEIRGLGGNDLLVSAVARIRRDSSAGVTLVGNAGDDVLIGGAADDRLNGALGNDRLFGGHGSDTADFSGLSQSIYVHLGDNRASGEGEDRLFDVENVDGTDYGDTILGDGRANRLNGRGGNDRIDGNSGDDVLRGGAGDDHLNGGEGVDTVSFDDARQSIFAHLGNARAGGEGEDALLGLENIVGSAFDDILLGDSRDNVIDGGAGNDQIDGNAGNDTIIGGAGDDRLNGGDGSDTVSYEGANQGVTVYLFDRWATGEGRDTLENIENLIGSQHSDRLDGNAAQNFITGLAGHDVIIGHEAIDVLFGGEGNDHLVGGTDSDALFGDGGDDHLEGNAGDDFLDGASGKDNLEGGSGSDTAINGEGGFLSKLGNFLFNAAFRIGEVFLVNSLVSHIPGLGWVLVAEAIDGGWYQSAAELTEIRNGIAGQQLDQGDMDFLEKLGFERQMLSRVRLRFGATLLDNWNLGRLGQIGGETDAQTFGFSIYFRAASLGRAERLALLAHELCHTLQFARRGESYGAFGRDYAMGFIDGLSHYPLSPYEHNPMELRAYAVQDFVLRNFSAIDSIQIGGKCQECLPLVYTA